MSVELAVKMASERVRDVADNYPTPLPFCHATLDLLPLSFRPKTALDPGAGLGPWGEAAAKRWPSIHLTGIELRDDIEKPFDYDTWHQGSFINLKKPKPPTGPFKDDKAMMKAWEQYNFDEWAWQQPNIDLQGHSYDFVVGNPPYKFAETFIRNGMAVLNDGGWLVFLLRLAFLEGQARAKALWREYPPHTVAVASRRPSFTGNGKTDATAYACFYILKGYRGPTNLSWLDWDNGLYDED